MQLAEISLILYLVENKRKHRRRGKKLRTPIHDKIYRVLNFLKTGKIVDYIHTSEIDEYFKYLYKLYELIYYESILYEYFLFKNIDRIIRIRDKRTLEEIFKVYLQLTKMKSELLYYFSNFINLNISIMIKNRFYGWRKHKDRLQIESFIVAYDNIKHVKFNPDKSKASVYIYQTAWLNAIVESEKILDEIKRYIYIQPAFGKEDRGNKIFSNDFNDISEESYIYDEFDYTNYEINDYDYNDDFETHYTEDDKELIDGFKLDLGLLTYNNDIENTESDCEDEFDEKRKILGEILKQYDLTLESIYKLTDAELEKLITRIKKDMKNKMRKTQNITFL